MLKVLRKMVTIPVKQTDLTSSSPSGSKGLEKSQAHAVRKFSSAQVPMKITDYQLSKKLSEGSFGVVYLAKDKSNSQLYAIKIVDKTKLDDEKELKNLAAESKTMMKLRNKPFVIHLYASFSNERYVFFVLDLAEMGDLRMVLEEFGAMSPYHAGYYIVQISAGLSALHNSRIIYRDLKLDNVLISHDGSVKLADFGLSKDVHNTGGRAMTFCGTLHYIAPEIILGGPYTYAVDWYALGLLVHLLYTGTFPLAGGEPPDEQGELMRVIISGDITPHKLLEPECCSFISWLTQMKPEKRPKHINEVRLHPWVSDLKWNAIIGKKLPAPHKLSDSKKNRHSIDPVIDHSRLYLGKKEQLREGMNAHFPDF